MLETRKTIDVDSTALEQGYQNCHNFVRKMARPLRWPFSNLPSRQILAIEALGCHFIRMRDLLDLKSDNGLSLDIWQDIRDDLSDAFLGKYTSCEVAALVETTNRYRIPKQYLFDPLIAVDDWIRNQSFNTFEELSQFASLLGGSSLTAMIPILGTTKTGYETYAIQCGTGMLLTQQLANTVRDIKQNKIFFAQQDIDDCNLSLHRLKLRQTDKSLAHLVRLYCFRIEKLFYAGGRLLDYLDYDGKRTMTSLLALHWQMLVKMKVDPKSVLSEDGVLPRREILILKAKHILGIEGNLPILRSQ